jgi:hypothetical protein
MIRIIAFVLMCCSLNAYGNADRVAVVVNNKIITEKEIFNRKNFIIKLQGLSSLGSREHEYLKEVARQTIIDEILIEEDAKKYKITVSEKDVNNFISNIESSRSMPNGYFKSQFGTNKEIYNSFFNKMKGELIKSRLSNEMFIRQLQVHESEIDDLAIKYGKKDATIQLRQLATNDLSDKGYDSIRKIQKVTKKCSDKVKDRRVGIENMTKKFSELSRDEREMVDNVREGHFTGIIEKDSKLVSYQVCARRVSSISGQEIDNISNIIGNRRLTLKLMKYIEMLRKKAYIKIM